MEYIIIGLLVIILVVAIISLTKNVNESNITERLGKLETEMVKELGNFKNDINDNLWINLKNYIMLITSHKQVYL